MPRKIIKNDIHTVLEMIREQTAIITGYEGKIPQIEIDIVMANIRRLYEDYVELTRMNKSGIPEPVQKEPEQEIVPQQEEELVKIIHPVAEEKSETPVTIPEVKEEAKEEVSREPEQIIKPIEPIGIKKGEEGKTIDLFGDAEPLTLADKYRDQKQSTHDKFIDANKDKTIADTILHPIKDLKSGIGVNDRFLFVNELFKGVMGDYDMAIAGLDSCTTLEQALEKLAEFGEILQWNNGADSVRKLEHFLRRKFS